MNKKQLPLINVQGDLSGSEYWKYSRQLSMRDIGVQGQSRLRAARVLVVGAGGLGSPVIMYLSAAGIGTIGIVDDDTVEISNLQRQVIHRADGLGRSKVMSAAAFVEGLNPDIQLIPHEMRLTPDNILSLIREYDLVVDATDNFSTRYVVNDACTLLGKPCVWGSVFQFSGQVSVFWAEQGPCYRCLFPEPPPPEYAPSCAEGGVIGAVCGAIGSVQTVEVVKLLTGSGNLLTGRLWMFDGLTGESGFVSIPKDPNCPACGQRTSDALLDIPEPTCVVDETHPPGVTAGELKVLLASPDTGEQAPVVYDIRSDYEWQDGGIPGAVFVGPDWVNAPTLPTTASEVILYCQSGIRSARALKAIQRYGIPAKHLEGGMNAWLETEGTTAR